MIRRLQIALNVVFILLVELAFLRISLHDLQIHEQ